MIRINENYVVDVNKYGYTLKKDKHKSKNQYVNIGYYNSMEGVLISAVEHMKRDKLQEGIHSIEESIEIIRNINSQFETLLKNAIALEQSTDINNCKDNVNV